MHRFITRLCRPVAVVASLLACAGAAQAQIGYAEAKAGTLPFTLVYPTATTARPVDMGPFRIEVAPDAPPLPGRRRLIVMSHGTAGNTTSLHTLAATLAGAGFVVAQPLHAGDNYRDASKAGPEAFKTRPGEVSRVIDALAADPAWRDRLDLQRVGVYGMSAGGGTGLALAGARWRLLQLVQHCSQNLEADKGFCFNGMPDPAAQAKRRAQYDAAKGVPEFFLPADMKTWHGGVAPDVGPDPRPDPRVAAVVVAVPAAAMLEPASLGRIRIPVGVVGASDDTMLVPAFHSGYVLRHCVSCKPLMEMKGATHLDVLAPWPASVATQVAAQQARGGELNPRFDPAQRDEAHRRIAGFFAATLAP